MTLPEHRPYTAGSRDYGPTPPPPSPLRCIHLMTDSRVDAWPVSNRGVWRIDPYRADGKNIFRDWHEYFARRTDPITHWLEAPGRCSAWHDYERLYGVIGDIRRYWDIADAENALREGVHWLVDGFDDAARAYTASGRTVAAHMGGVEEGGWADRVRRQENDDASADAFGVVTRTCERLVKAGVVIGLDAASGESISSGDFGLATLIRSLGGRVQIESQYGRTATWWHGYPIRCVYERFLECHVTPNADNAKEFPKFGTDEFRDLYPDMTVSIFPTSFLSNDARYWENNGALAADPKRTLLLKKVAAKSRELIAGGVNVLTDATSIEMAMGLKTPILAKEFLP